MKILLIEDDQRLSASISKHLKAERFAVDPAFNGVEGEVYAKVNDYDVVILDILLPRQNGWVTCEHIRAAGIKTPILMLTALDDPDDKVRGLNTGADDYLAKPFHAGELVARLRALGRRKTEIRTAVIEKFGVILDSASYTVHRDQTKIILSAKEFSLLELFMMHAGKVVTREMITEHLWDMNYEAKSNIIESFVRFLRNKIDKGFTRPLIHTIRGAGYMFSDTLEN